MRGVETRWDVERDFQRWGVFALTIALFFSMLVVLSLFVRRATGYLPESVADHLVWLGAAIVVLLLSCVICIDRGLGCSARVESRLAGWTCRAALFMALLMAYVFTGPHAPVWQLCVLWLPPVALWAWHGRAACLRPALTLPPPPKQSFVRGLADDHPATQLDVSGECLEANEWSAGETPREATASDLQGLGPSSSQSLEPRSAGESRGVEGQWDQQTERGITDDGAVYCSGSVKLRFAEGQRQTHHFVVLWPPLPTVPEVELEVLDDSELELSVAALVPHGWRIDCKRDDTDVAQVVHVGFVAVAVQGDSGVVDDD